MADGAKNITFEDIGIQKIVVDIKEDSGYTFELRRKEGCMAFMNLYDDNMHYIISSNVVGNYEKISIYLARGRYIVMVKAYSIDNIDTYRFSAAKDNSSTPFDKTTAQEIKVGDIINVPAGNGDMLFKLTYNSKLDYGFLIYLEANNEADFTVYDSYFTVISDGRFDENSNTTSVSLDFNTYFDGIIDDKTRYILVTEPDKDFTLSCNTYADHLISGCAAASFDEASSGSVTICEYEMGTEYYADYRAKFTPEKDGFYKVEVNCDDDIKFGSDYTYSYLPDIRKFNYFAGSDGNFYSVEELKAGNTYVIWLYGFKDKEINDFTVTLTDSSEDEYNLWYDTYKGVPDGEPVEFECEEIALGEEIYVSFRSMEETEDYYSDFIRFKFTAPEDMTVVAYSKDSVNSNLSVYDEEFNYTGWFDDSGKFTKDFTVCITLEKGESCYFELSSDEFFGDGFYFSVVDIDDYTSLI